MPDVYTKIVDEDGNDSYVVAEQTPQDDESFFADKRYQDVADRDKKRRVKHSDLVTKLGERGLIVDDQGNVTEKQVAQQVVPPAPLDEDALYRRFVTQMATDKTDADNQASEKRLRMNTYMTQHQLKGNDVMNILLASDDPSETAGVLGRLGLKFEDTTGGQGDESDVADTLTTLFESVQRKMGKPDTN